jgi:hypothetical protein
MLTLSTTGIKTNQLVMYTAKAAVCSEIVQNTESKASTKENFSVLHLVVSNETVRL